MSGGVNFEGNEMGLDREKEEPQVEQALKHFRDSVHAWSEREMGVARNPAPSRSVFLSIRMPALNWAAAAVMALTAIAGPIAYYERQVNIEQKQHEAKAQADKKLAEEVQAKQQAYAMDDEELLKHVDSDIAQQTPDAMDSLASLMTDARTN